MTDGVLCTPSVPCEVPLAFSGKKRDSVSSRFHTGCGFKKESVMILMALRLAFVVVLKETAYRCNKTKRLLLEYHNFRPKAAHNA